MEYTSHSLTGCKLLVSFEWNITTERYRNRFTITWQGNILRVTVQSANHGFITGRLTDFDIRFNQESHHVRVIDAPMYRGKRGEIPDLKGSTHRLVFSFAGKSFHLYEKPLEAHEIQQKISNPFAGICDHLDQPVKVKNERSSDYDFLPRRNESWIMVSDRMATREYQIALPLNGVILWIKRIHAQKVNPNVNLYRYEFFSKSIRPLPLEMNGFVCTGAYDACKNTSNGVLCSINFEVTDRNGDKRILDCHRQGEEGLMAFLHFMLKISKFHDWKDVDSMRELTSHLGISHEQIKDMLSDDLKGTGIIIH